MGVWNRMPIRSGARVLAAAMACAGLAIALPGCRSGHAAEQKAAGPTASPVETLAAKQETVVHWTDVTGSLVSLEDVPLSSKASGRLAEVYVRQGDVVAPGQVVARLDMSDQESQVRSADGAVAAARARVAQAEAALRMQLVSSTSAVHASEAAYEQQQVNTRTGIESAQAALEAAKAQLSQVREGARSQEVRRAETQVKIAKANVQKAQSDVRRNRDLAKEGALSQSTLEQYETAAEVANEQLRAAQEALSLIKEGARTQEVTQAEQAVRQAEERLRQAQAAASLDKVRKADVETARAGLAQNDVRRAEVQAARAALQQAVSSQAIARKALADAFIRSPIAGQVAARTGEPGQIVSPGTPILRVVSLDQVFFEPSLPDRELGGVRVGQTVEVKVNAFPGRVFAGTVTKVYPSGSQSSRSFPIRVTISNPDRLLRPQMFAQGRIRTAEQKGAVVVPVAALLRDSKDDTKARVFVVESGAAHERAITIGMTTPDDLWVEAKGIESGAAVVVSGQRALGDGDSVSAKDAAAAQDSRQ